MLHIRSQNKIGSSFYGRVKKSTDYADFTDFLNQLKAKEPQNNNRQMVVHLPVKFT
jgi:hypothetical protein